MASLFTRIINGELPGRFVWSDERCVAFLTIAPIADGHTLVVPRSEVDHWVDLDDDLAAHLMVVSRKIGAAQMEAFSPNRVGVIIAGLEVPHTHIHVIPIESESDLDFRRADPNAGAEALDTAAHRLREALRSQGHPEVTS
ncbi:MAG: HIT family protein [Acidimicrobiales bacterium]|nr:HIT family protein [Acidimicrobiales bacterium]